MLESDLSPPSEPLKDPGLSQLQGQIKNVMIPLLIKIFQLRLEVQQTTSPPCRLQSSKPKMTLEELISQLNRLDEDLKLLHIWNQSCQKQIEKVLREAKEGTLPSLGNSVQKDYKMNPAVQKSFQGALLCRKDLQSPSWKKYMKKLLFLTRKAP